MDTKKINLNLSDRKQSEQGKVSIVIGLITIALLGVAIYSTVHFQGKAGEEVGFIGLIGLFSSIIGLIFAYNGKISDKVYDFYPKIGLLLNGLVLCILLVLFIFGLVM